MALSADLLAQIKGARAKYSKGSRAIKLGEGKNVVRIVAKPGEVFWADLGVHWIKTEVGGKPVAVVGCHDAVKGEPCPVCTAIDKASKSITDDESLKIAKEWKAKKSVLVNAIIRTGSNKSDNVQVLELTPTTFGTIAANIEEYGEAGKDLLEIKPGTDVGYEFVIERRGRGLDTEYTVMLAPKAFKVPADVFEQMTDLKAFMEKEFFRGEDSKAVRAIGTFSGTDMRGLLPAAGAAAPALTGPKTVAPAATTAAPAADPVADAIEVLEVIENAPTTAPASPAPAAAKPAAAPAAADANFGAALPVDEIDEMLKGLGG